MTFKETIRSAGLGRLAYRVWFQPKGRIEAILAAGGPLEMLRDERSRREMEAAAYSLPVLSENINSAPLEIHILTGKRFWYQTIFCLWTLARNSNRTMCPVIYDDGTLTSEHCRPIERLFSTARFVSQMETISRLDTYLPSSRFPTLRERWQNYPNIRKLTDVHAGQKGWKLVIDSDLLFFRRPSFVIDWLDQPTKPFHAVDCETSYGYSRQLMNSLAGTAVADFVNVGLTGLNSSALDWEKLEFWMHVLIEREGTSYYLEQALIAMVVAGRDCAIASSVDYVTKPADEEARQCRAIMHHYVANSKRWYFRHCWRVARQA
jgi:hypothetical protein